MAITVKFRRGSTTESNSFLGEEGELYIDKDKDTVVVHDGVTVGGKPLATESFVNDGLSFKANTSNLSIIAFSGSYNDLLDKPYFKSNVSEFINDADYANTLYVDTEIDTLTNSINNQLSLKADQTAVDSQINTLTNSINNQLSFKANSADLAIVATSGSYNDLLNKPTGMATEVYVNTQIANLVDSSPATLDTLNELAAALGDDPNFATTVSNQIGLKANSADLATVATTGSYNDLLNKPTGLATESWVTSQNYLTSITSSQVAQTLTGITNSSFGASAYAGNSSSYITQQIGHSAMLVGATSGNSNKFAMLLSNAYASDTGERFMRDGTASKYIQNAGVHVFQTSNINGTASSLATWTTTLLMDLNGNIGIKKENPSYPIDVNGTARATSFVIGSNSGDKWEVSVDNTSNTLFFKFGGVNKMKLDSSGNLTVTGNITAFGTV